jgi:signal peptidase I
METQKETKKKKNIWVSLVSYIILLGFLLAIFIPGLLPFKHYIIVTGSMAPNINIGDLVIVDTTFDRDNLEVGDIIGFQVDVDNTGQKRVVLHYLSSIIEDEQGNKTYKTIAHNSQVEDNWTISADDITGLYVHHFGYAGKILLFLQSRIGLFVTGVNVVGILLIKWVLKK